MALNRDVANFSPRTPQPAPAPAPEQDSHLEAIYQAEREKLAARAALARDAFKRNSATVMAKVQSGQNVYNNSTQLPIAGANKLDTSKAPGFLGIDDKLQALEGRFPRFFNGLDKTLRFGGVAAAGAGFGLSVYNLVSTWNKQTTANKALNIGATAANGAATYYGVQFLRGAASASRMMGGFMGVAGTIYQGIQAFKEFNDPNKTAGQRGFAVTSAVLQGIGTVACFIPGGQVVGFPLIMVGGLLGMAGDWLGKMPWANAAFSWIGKQLKGVADFGKKALGAVENAGKKVVDFGKKAENVAKGAWHAVTSWL